MLPHSYELPAAILLVLGGALSCFAGYRLFKIVLGIYGFVLGAMLASSAMGITNTTGMIVASLVGGVCGALLLMFAYFVGIALVGAGLGALVAHVAWSEPRHGGDPPAVAVIVLSIARIDRRDVPAALRDHRRDRVRRRVDGDRRRPGDRRRAQRRGAAASAADVWILYPTSPAPGQRLGADRVDRARPHRHGRAARDDERQEEMT